jgi:hypothetical protein
MKTIFRNLALTAIIGISPMAFAGNGSPLSTTVVGHMCVTLLSPVAVSQNKALQFTSTTSNASVSSTFDATKGTIKIAGNTSAYSITVSNKSTNFSQNGKNIAIEDFSATSNTNENGSSSILLDGNIKVSETVAMSSIPTSPLSVTINYN